LYFANNLISSTAKESSISENVIISNNHVLELSVVQDKVIVVHEKVSQELLCSLIKVPENVVHVLSKIIHVEELIDITQLHVFVSEHLLS
jgi:hypothetical protein